MLTFNLIKNFRTGFPVTLLFKLSVFLLLLSPFVVNADGEKTGQPLAPFTLSFAPSVYNGFNISCFGLNDGSIDMTITGGTPPFTISWSTSDTTEDIASLIAGNYVVTVIDSDGTTVTDNVTLIEPVSINISGIVTDVLCNTGTDGAVDITVTGGAGGYVYLWSNTAVSEDLLNVGANIYTVTVTDVNNCADTLSFNVAEPLPLQITSSIVDSVNCFGGSDGSINITIGGGTATYNFLWSDGNTNEDRSGLNAGAFTVTVTDQHSCTVVQSFVVGQPSQLTAGISKVDATCGNSNGSATATNNGGTGGVTYLWNTTATTQTIANLSSGVYTVTITDVNGCTDNSTTTITNSSPPSITSFIVDSVNCFAGNDGNINITVSGGLPSYNFLWNDANVSEDRTGLTASTYTVTVTDQNNCTAIQSFIVLQPAQLIASITKLDATCGLNNGSASAGHTGGTGGVTYLWSNSSPNQSITNLAANTYTVTITDIYSCTAQASATIINNGIPVIASFTVDSVSCFGGSDGSINITVSGGTPTYSFLWNDGNTNEDRTGLGIGTYTVTVNDQNSCTTNQSFIVREPTQLTASITKVNATCGFNNGSASANHSGGTGGVIYLWNTFAVSQSITNLAPNNYSVTVTDINGCTANASTIINNISGPSITSFNIDSVKCFSGNDGAINITVGGGTPTYSFLWNDGNTDEDRTGLTAGTYTVTITDANSCTVVQAFSVFQPALLTASITKFDATCGNNNGIAFANHAGGTGAVTYLWSTFAVAQLINNLAPSTYTVTITDIHGCTAIASTTILNISGPSISSVVIDSVNCFNGTDGSINITVSGGTPTYNFLWADGNTNEDRTGLNANTYTVTVTDQNSCTATQSFVVSQPAQLTVNISKIDATCGNNNGSATANPSGGTGGITYLWNTSSVSQAISGLFPNTYTVTVTDINSCTATSSINIINANGPVITSSIVDSVKCFSGSNGNINITVQGGAPGYFFLWNDGNTNEDRSGIIAGIYTVTVTDQNSCTTAQTFTVGQPSLLTASIIKTDPTCGANNGSAIANASGGTGGVTYLWSNSSTSQNIVNLSASTYTVTITDINSCTATASATLINAGSPSIITTIIDSVKCFGGNDGGINITVSSGTPVYNYLWNDGNTNEDRVGLIAGPYTVTITDQHSCTAIQSFTVLQPSQITVNITSSNATCGNNNGSATANAAGGTGGITFLWSNSATSQTINGLPGNNFTVTVTDIHSCKANDTVIIATNPSPVVTLASVTNVACFGDTTGAININVSGGTQPVTFNWSNSQTTEDISNLSSGNYSIIASDIIGCTDTLSIFVSQSSIISINDSVVNALCGDSTGSIVVFVSGGNPSYSYSWSNGQTTSLINNIYAGTYTLTITDDLGCELSVPIGVGNIDGPQVSLLSHNMTKCFASSDGSIAVNVTNGTTPYHFLWSNNDTTQNIINITAGIYLLTVTDQHGCIGVFSDTITEPQPLSVSAILNNATCFQPNGSIVITPSGGTPLYSYLWSNGVTSSTNASIYADTIYSLTITDDNLCIFDTAFSVSNSGSPVINLVTKTNVSCFGLSDGAIDINVTGGVPPYSYVWSGQLQVTQDIQNLPVGGYDVQVVDTVGCTSTAHYDITEPTEIIVTFPQLINTNCGQSNGIIVTSATGGNPGYTYQWSNGSNTDSISGLDAGSYTVTIADQSGCTKSGIANISDLGGPSIISVDSTLVTCPGGSNGSISITANGGAPPLSYSWTNVSSNSSSLSGLPANIYTVTVADAAGCIVLRSVKITDPPDFVINATLSQLNPPYNLTCYHSGDGSIDISVTGGTQPYLYIWSTGSNNEDQFNIASGSYNVLIRDTNNCTTTDTFLLTEPPEITAYAGTDVTICGQSYYTLNADSPVYGNGYWEILLGGAYTHILDSTYHASYVDSLQQDNNIFLWTVTDGKCGASDEVIVTVQSEIKAFAGSDKNDLCDDTYTLTGTIQQTGIDIKYYWSVISGGGVLDDSSKANTILSGVSVGSNLLTWTFINGGCIDVDSLFIVKLDSVDCLSPIELPTAFSPNGDGHNDYFMIKGIEDYRNNHFTVFNRWGMEVYDKQGYLNEWKGDNESNAPLPDATYFYLLKIEGSKKVYKGYIDLRR